MARKAVRRRWYLDHHGIRRLGSKEKGFRYESSDGRPIDDSRSLERIASLRIPPAWENVRIARGAGAPLQAIGQDSKGRWQYLYHPRFREKREEEKFLRLVEFAEALPRLRRRVSSDLKRKDRSRDRTLAAMVRLIDQGFFRIGNDRSARNEATFGLSTVTSDHVAVKGAEIHFDYVGKWRKNQRRVVRDAAVARVIRDLAVLPGDEVFKWEGADQIVDVKDRHVNDYIRSVIGDDFSAKDFRTWAGTLLCSIALALQGQADTKTARKRRVKKAVEATAETLGNTATVCRKSYICPRVIDDYMDGRPFDALKRARGGSPLARTTLSKEEKAMVRFLRETIADRRRRARQVRHSRRQSDRETA